MDREESLSEAKNTMQRPIMDPRYLEEPAEAPLAPRFDWQWLSHVWRVLRRLGKLLLIHPFRWRKPPEVIDDTPAWRRFVRAAAYRLIFVPILLVLLACAMVYIVTHPYTAPGDADPISMGVYYDPVTLVAADGVRLEGWLAPVIDARRVITDKDKVLRQKSPGVVLVHDMGQSYRQMLPLVRPLHEAGYVVLVVGVRGSGGTDSVGQTFGLNESLDVRAAVEMLRRRQFVDEQRIAIVGQGTGATAALLACEKDLSAAGLVLIDMPKTGPAQIAECIADRFDTLAWLGPVCKWTFEVTYQASVDDLDVTRELARRPVNATLQLPSGVITDQVQPITTFLHSVLAPQVAKK